MCGVCLREIELDGLKIRNISLWVFLLFIGVGRGERLFKVEAPVTYCMRTRHAIGGTGSEYI